jgi:TMEM199 family protein
MVLLTTTPSMLEALEEIQSLEGKVDGSKDVQQKNTEAQRRDGQDQEGNEKSTDNEQGQCAKAEKAPAEPSLSNPRVGNPISHGQVLDIIRDLKALRIQPRSLEALLRGSKVYVPPLPPKSEPVSDYLEAG